MEVNGEVDAGGSPNAVIDVMVTLLRSDQHLEHRVFNTKTCIAGDYVSAICNPFDLK